MLVAGSDLINRPALLRSLPMHSRTAPRGRSTLRSALRFVGLLLVALLLGACSKDADNGKPGKPKGGGDDKPVTVVTAVAVQRAFAQPVTGIATLRAQESVLVTARTSGRIEEILFSEGAMVAAGAPLVRLEDAEERAAYAAAKANADTLATRMARIDALHAQGLVSQDERDAQSQALKEAQARAELARVQLALRTVRAPFAGRLGFRQVSAGALVQPGEAIVSLDALTTLRAEFSVPETQLALVAPGNAISARAAAWPARVFNGVVTMIDSRVDATTRTLTVQARIDNRDGALKPGMLLTVALATRERPVLFVPEAALLPENSRQYVWRVDAGQKATRVEVSTGLRDNGFVEIVAGLTAGELVVIEGQGNLRDGRSVVEAGGNPSSATRDPQEKSASAASEKSGQQPGKTP